jgi:hypothetical protein
VTAVQGAELVQEHTGGLRRIHPVRHGRTIGGDAHLDPQPPLAAEPVLGGHRDGGMPHPVRLGGLGAQPQAAEPVTGILMAHDGGVRAVAQLVAARVREVHAMVGDAALGHP